MLTYTRVSYTIHTHVPCTIHTHVRTYTRVQDGRVRAVFEDRVVAEMDGSHAYASILSTEGERITVRVEQPVGYEW